MCVSKNKWINCKRISGSGPRIHGLRARYLRVCKCWESVSSLCCVCLLLSAVPDFVCMCLWGGAACTPSQTSF